MLKKNLFYNILLTISQFLFPLISFPYASRILGPDGVGDVTFIDSFTQYFILFSALGIPVYGIREIAKIGNAIELRRTFFSEIISIHVLSTILFSVVYISFAFTIPSLRNHLPMVFIGILMMFSNIFTFEWYFQGIEKFKFITIRTLLTRSISLILMFFILKKGGRPVMYYTVLASGYLLNAVVNLYYAINQKSFGNFNLNLKKHLKPLFVILSSSLAISVYILMDNILLGLLQNNSAVGLYSTALRIIRIPITLVSAISSIMIPQISLAYSNEDFSKVQELINKSFSFICILAIPISAGIILVSPFLVYIFAGVKFAGAATVLSILSINLFLIGLNNLFGLQILTPIGKEGLLLKAVTIGMFFSIVTNLFLIKYFSYTGAAITNVITEIIVTGTTFYYAKKNLSFTLNIKILYSCLIGVSPFLLIYFIARYLPITSFFQNITIITGCCIIYFLYVYIFLKDQYVERLKMSLLTKFNISKKLNN
jgi:O-antigen/teichoic acid export membrane protein